jgi:hypothetical protein
MQEERKRKIEKGRSEERKREGKGVMKKKKRRRRKRKRRRRILPHWSVETVRRKCCLVRRTTITINSST